MLRARALSAVLILSLAPLSALAGSNEDAFLLRLVGKWSGAGKLTGAETGELACTGSVRELSVGINFRVKCDVPEFGAQNFSGVVSYNDEKGQYEAKSQGGEITVGTKSGNAVVFTAKMKGIAIGTSVMKLTSTKITVDTTVKRPGNADNGEIKSHLELTKS